VKHAAASALFAVFPALLAVGAHADPASKPPVGTVYIFTAANGKGTGMQRYSFAPPPAGSYMLSFSASFKPIAKKMATVLGDATTAGLSASSLSVSSGGPDVGVSATAPAKVDPRSEHWFFEDGWPKGGAAVWGYSRAPSASMKAEKEALLGDLGDAVPLARLSADGRRKLLASIGTGLH
jgi:hypothetical protein